MDGRRGRFGMVVVAFLSCPLAEGGTPPAGFVETVLVSAGSASTPTAIGYEPGSGDLFVLEKGDGSSTGQARVRVRDRGTGTVTTALNLSCVDSRGERGLLGIAFAPDYLVPGGASRFVYLYYTRAITSSGSCSISGRSASARNVVARFRESGGTLLDPDVLLEGPALSGATNHNGGTLRFAPDGTLFVSMGDNDTDADADPASRDLSDLRGKLLRIRADGTVPPDNPFVGRAGARPEIWAWGLRNPFRFSIDPVTGTPYIADVGENTWEEIDAGVSGADYGYPCFEASTSFRSCSPAPTAPRFPIYAYGHGNQTAPVRGGSITGGPVYRGTSFPDGYDGRLFFGDYVSGWIRHGRFAGNGTLTDVQLFMADATSVVDMVVSPAGCLTWVSIGGAGVRDVCFLDADVDLDEDGFTPNEGDCDDSDAASHPDAPELCDGNDNDCSGSVPAAERDPEGDALVPCEPWDDVQGDDPDVTAGGDNCPATANPSQSDHDADGFGDACETGVLLADIDLSSRVDGFDLARLARAFGSVCAAARYDAATDLDRDCTVDGNDLSLLAGRFGRSR